MVILPSQENVVASLRHIFTTFMASQALIRPHFHMTGPSGSGKSYLVKQLAEDMGIPVLELSAASLTSEGLSGNSLSKALRNLRNQWASPNIVFVDEFDKLFQRNGETTESFRSAVQDEFLTALESDTTQIFTDYGKYEPVKISNSLFVFAGAYSNQPIHDIKALMEAGLRTEFVGRVPLVIATKKVDLDELIRMIPKTVLFQNYLQLFPEKFDANKAAKEIAAMVEKEDENLNIGIRILGSCTHRYFMNHVLGGNRKKEKAPIKPYSIVNEMFKKRTPNEQ